MCSFSICCYFRMFWHHRLVLFTLGMSTWTNYRKASKGGDLHCLICFVVSAWVLGLIPWHVWGSAPCFCQVASRVSYLAFILVMIKSFICSLSQLPQWILSTLNLCPLLWQLVWCPSAFKSTSVSLFVARMVQMCQDVDESWANLFSPPRNVIELGGFAGFTGLEYDTLWIKTIQNLTLCFKIWQLDFPSVKKREGKLVARATLCLAPSRICSSQLKVLFLRGTGLHVLCGF